MKTQEPQGPGGHSMKARGASLNETREVSFNEGPGGPLTGSGGPLADSGTGVGTLGSGAVGPIRYRVRWGPDSMKAWGPSLNEGARH